MAYNFDTAFIDEMAGNIETASMGLDMARVISPPALDAEYINNRTLDPGELEGYLEGILDFIDAHYHELESQPVWNTGWPPDLTFAPITSTLAGINYEPLSADVDLYRRQIWGETTTGAAIKTNILAAVDSGEIEFWESWQESAFNRGNAKELRRLSKALDHAGAKVGARGFSKPNSQVAMLQSEALTAYQDAREALNMTIMKGVVTHAHEYLQASIAAGVTLEEIFIRFTEGYNQFLTQAKRQLIENYKSRLQAELLKLEGLVMIARQGIDFQSQNMKARMIKFKSLIETFKADIAYDTVANSKAEKTAYFLKAYGDMLDAYNRQVANMRTEIADASNKVESEIDRLKLSTTRYNTSLKAALNGFASVITASATAIGSGSASTIDVTGP